MNVSVCVQVIITALKAGYKGSSPRALCWLCLAYCVVFLTVLWVTLGGPGWALVYFNKENLTQESSMYTLQ